MITDAEKQRLEEIRSHGNLLNIDERFMLDLIDRIATPIIKYLQSIDNKSRAEERENCAKIVEADRAATAMTRRRIAATIRLAGDRTL